MVKKSENCIPTHNRPWLTTHETAAILNINLNSLRQQLAQGLIHPVCLTKFGDPNKRGQWRFRRDIIECRGIVYKDDWDVREIERNYKFKRMSHSHSAALPSAE